MRRSAFLVPIACVIAWSSGAQERPLPDRETFLREARLRLASNAQIQSRYTYRERVTELKLNPFGRMGTGPIHVYEVYPIDDELTYRRLIERDGIAVPAAEIAAADRRFLAQYHDWHRTLAREGQSQREARLRREADAKARDRARATEAIEIFTFTIDGRDTIDGQPAIVVGFAPKPTARPASREARVAASFAGKAWVHEHEFEVMRVEATAIDDTSFGFGLIARLHKGARADIRRHKLDGVWLPSHTTFSGTGRALLLRKVSFEFSRQYSDYRLFDPEQLPRLLGAGGRGSR